MRLPGEQAESFLILQPFVPFSQNDTRKDLAAFMVAKSDPADYGKLEVFVMPSDQHVDGPALADAKINQATEISSQITLLNTSGSKVLLGNMLVVPVNQSLLYIRPLYVQAVNTPQPQFKRAIVVYGDKAVMRNTLRESLDAIFGAAPPTLEQVAPGGEAPAPPGVPGGAPNAAPNVKALLDRAAAAFNDAQAALTRGDLAAYQAKVNEGADLVRQAQQAAAGSAPPTTSTTTASA
jgi:hypothetical protein